MTVKTFVFNSFRLNTYLLFDGSKEAIIIDAGNNNPEEDKELFDFIKSEKLTVKGLYYTHSHVDHIVGNNSILKEYKIDSFCHKDGVPFFEQAETYSKNLGFDIKDIVFPKKYISENDEISFGKSKLKVLHTPGHAAGSLCFYSEEDQFVIVGDVIFKDSIGRTDLPTGDFDLLSKSINEKLYTLPNAVKVMSGHGPSTTIGYEKNNNPFVNKI